MPSANDAINVAANMNQAPGTNSHFLGQPPVITRADTSGNVQTTAKNTQGMNQMANMNTQAPTTAPYGYGVPTPVVAPANHNTTNSFMNPQGQPVQTQQVQQPMQQPMPGAQQVYGQQVQQQMPQPIPQPIAVPNHLQGATAPNVVIPAHLQSATAPITNEDMGLYKDYVLPVSQGLISSQNDLDLAERFRQQSFNAGIDPDNATRSLEHTLSFNQEQERNRVATAQTALKQQWGQSYDQNIQEAKQAFKNVFPTQEAQQQAVASGLLNNPQNLVNLQNLNSQMGNTPLQPGAQVAQAMAPKSPNQAIVDITNTMADFGAANTVDTAQSNATKTSLKASLDNLLRQDTQAQPGAMPVQPMAQQMPVNPAYGNVPVGVAPPQPAGPANALGLQQWSSSPVF